MKVKEELGGYAGSAPGLKADSFRIVDPEDAGRGTDPAYEAVNHPQHYNEHPSGVECIDIIEFMPHNIGAAMKYLWRAGLKPGATSRQDVEKAIWYATRQLSLEERRVR